MRLGNPGSLIQWSLAEGQCFILSNVKISEWYAFVDSVSSSDLCIQVAVCIDFSILHWLFCLTCGHSIYAVGVYGVQYVATYHA